MDFVAIFCFLIHHCVPFRSNLVYFHCLKPRDVGSDYVDSVRRKESKIIRLVFSSFVDAIFFLPGIAFTLIAPSLWSCTSYGLKKAFTPLPNPENLSEWDDCYWMARLVLISRIPYALYDLFCLPLAALAFLSPFRHTAFRIALVENGLEMCGVGLEETPLEEIPQHGAQEVALSPSLIPEVAVTVLGDEAPSAPPAAGSEEDIPESNATYPSFEYSPAATATRPSPAAPSAPKYSSDAAVPSRVLQVTTLRSSSPVYNELYFNATLRRECVYFGVTALVDLLLLPILLPLVLTWYRYAPIREQLFGTAADPSDALSAAPAPGGLRRKRPKPWGFQEYGIISRQFCFLLLDLLFCPLLLTTFLTQYRWLPVAITRENDDLTSFRSLQVYATLLWTLVLMTADLFVLPFAALVLVTWYRSEPLRIAFANKRIRFGFASSSTVAYSCCNDLDDDDCCDANFSAFYLHLVALGNFLVVLHDLIIVPIFLAIGLLSGVRTARTINLIRSTLTSCTCCASQPADPNPPAPVSAVSAPPASDLEQATPQSLTPLSSTAPRHFSQMTRDGDTQSRTLSLSAGLDFSAPLQYPDLFPSSHWRMELYFEAINSLLDLPFVLVALVVICTGWRAASLFRSLAALEVEFKSYSWYHHRNSDDLDCWCCDCCCCCDQIDINWKRRATVIMELLLLLRDLLFLLPLCVIIASLYRLPGLILDLISRCSPINRTSPRLVATKGKVLVPETHGPISIHLTCKTIRNSEFPNPSPGSYTGPAKLFVDGVNFWSEIGRVFGDSVMQIGKGMLPLKLAEGVGVAEGVIQLVQGPSEEPQEADEEKTAVMATALPTADLESGGDNVWAVWIKIDVGSAKRTTILKNLRKLNQNTRLLIQLEARPQGAQSPVVVSVAPTVGDLTRVFNLETENLEPASLDQQLTQRSSLVSSLPESGGIVEDFWIIVALHFAEILMDLSHLLLFLFVTVLVPWRFPQLVCSLLESNLRSLCREATELFALHCDSQKCLAQYLAEMAPLANSLAKSVRLGRGYQLTEFILYTEEEPSNSYLTHYYPLSYFSLRQIHSRLKRLEAVSLKRFEKDSEKVIQRAAKGAPEIQELGLLLSRHRELQLMRLAMWGFRCSANMMSSEEVTLLNRSLEQHETSSSALSSPVAVAAPSGDRVSFAGLMAEVVSHFDAKHKAQEKAQELLIRDHLRSLHRQAEKETQTVSFGKRWNGLSHRSANEMRKIIRSAAARALRDIGILLLTLLLVVTVVRVLPLVRDLHEAQSWSITSPTAQRIILKHLRGVADDTKRFFQFLFFATVVVLLGVGLPSFLRELPRRSRSLEDATNCAKENLKNTLRYLCELFALFAAWKTYKLVVTAAIYSVLVPPACLAEAIPRRFSSVQLRFIIGVLVWFGLGAGAIVLAVRTEHWKGEDGDDGEGNAAAVRRSFCALYGLLMGVILLAAGSLSRRKEYTSPIKDSATGFLSPSWSHLLSLVLGPLESLQLSSVVLYFFWQSTRDAAGGGGSFTFPVVYLFDSEDPSDSSGSSFGYSLALGLASVCVLLWLVIVSVPLVYDSQDKSLIRSFQQNPAFDAIYSLLSRLIFVSIVATLLRPYSCVSSGGLVLSTNPHQTCGGNDSSQNEFSSAVASSLLLLFFLLTSTIFHSDAPDLLTPEDDLTMRAIDTLGQLDDLPVRFAPLYAIVIRLGQLAICFLCFGFASLSDRRTELLLIILLSAVLFLWTAFYPWGRGCSIPAISVLRAAGFLVVMWTSIVCYCRGEEENGGAGDGSGGVAWNGYVGLLIAVLGLWFGGAGVAIFVQRTASQDWMTTLREGGLDVAIAELVSTADLVLVEDAIGGGTRQGKQTRKEAFVRETRETLTASGLGLVLVRFEEKILADRLSAEFICNRASWRRVLLSGRELTYERIARQARVLREAIIPRPPVALLNKHVLATVLENKLPEYVAWEVFKFLYDMAPLQRLLSPLMTLTESGDRPLALQRSYGGYTWWHDEAYTVTLLRLTKKLLYEVIRTASPQPPQLQQFSAPAPPLPRLANTGRGVESLVMDGREWTCSACTLSNPSSRLTCDACNLPRSLPRNTSF
jgi:hypothetical protein